MILNNRLNIMHMLFAQGCLLCGAASVHDLCSPCHASLPHLPPHRCTVCALPLATSGVCGACIANPPAFDRTIAAPLAGKPRTLIDGFTPEQRFFLAYAQARRGNARDEALRLQIRTDPHSPGRFRVNGPLSNMPEFAKAFGCKEGDPMVRPAGIRARIW